MLATPSLRSNEAGMSHTQPGSPGLPDLVLLYLHPLTSGAALGPGVQVCDQGLLREREGDLAGEQSFLESSTYLCEDGERRSMDTKRWYSTTGL